MKFKIGFYILIIIFCIMMNNCFIVVVVSGCSMNPTYQDGQKIVCYRNNSLYNNLEKDKCIVFKLSDNISLRVKSNQKEVNINDNFSDMYIKRIVGVEGDKIDIIDNKLYINDTFICDCILSVSNKSYIITKNEFFVMGDNYEDSMDSRYFGTINKNNIIYVVY